MEELDNKKYWMATKRIETLVDGIFAIAMTLLVLNLVVPEITGPLSEAVIRSSLSTLYPKFSIFVLSFILLAVFWNLHHRAFHYINKADDGLLWLNVIWLLFIVMVPFSQTLIGEYGDFAISHLVYNLNMMGIALFIALSWYYAVNRNLIDENIDKAQLSKMGRGYLAFIFIALLAVTLTFIIPGWTSLTYILIIPIEMINHRL